MSECPAPEHGMTLIELLITVTVMGLVAVGMLAAIAAMTMNAVTNRDNSQGQATLRRYADQLAAAPYTACGGGATNAVLTSYKNWLSNPAGVTVTKLETGAPGASITDPITYTDVTATNCSETAAQLQRITLQVTSGSFTGTAIVIKRPA